MTQAGPRAVGRRATYAEMPPAIRHWADATLGSAVVTTAEQVGGFSPGCATRVTCADGTRAFVKAVGAELNPDTPTLFRREILALTLLGSHPLWADLLASYDEGGWVALLLEDVAGTHPDLDDDSTMTRLLVATDELTAVMSERVPVPPTSPAPEGGGLTDMSLVFLNWTKSFPHAASVPPDLMPAWVAERAEEFQSDVAALAALPMDHLVHWDSGARDNHGVASARRSRRREPADHERVPPSGVREIPRRSGPAPGGLTLDLGG